MTHEKLLTVRDVSHILGVSEREILDLAESGSLPAYKIAGVYLRFKKEQVEDFKKKTKSFKNGSFKRASFKDMLFDFFYFYDFYILAATLFCLMLYFILKG